MSPGGGEGVQEVWVYTIGLKAGDSTHKWAYNVAGDPEFLIS